MDLIAAAQSANLPQVVQYLDGGADLSKPFSWCGFESIEQEGLSSLSRIFVSNPERALPKSGLRCKLHVQGSLGAVAAVNAVVAGKLSMEVFWYLVEHGVAVTSSIEAGVLCGNMLYPNSRFTLGAFIMVWLHEFPGCHIDRVAESKMLLASGTLLTEFVRDEDTGELKKLEKRIMQSAISHGLWTTVEWLLMRGHSLNEPLGDSLDESAWQEETVIYKLIRAAHHHFAVEPGEPLHGNIVLARMFSNFASKGILHSLINSLLDEDTSDSDIPATFSQNHCGQIEKFAGSIIQTVLEVALQESVQLSPLQRTLNKQFLSLPKQVRPQVWKFLVPVVEIPVSLLTETSKQLIHSILCAPWAHIWIKGISACDFPIDESIEHAEEPAFRDEQLLSLQSDHDFADLVEMQIHAPSRCSSFHSCDDGLALENSSFVAEKVHLLRFGGGDGNLFRQALLDGPWFRRCREEMERQNCSCELPSQAFVFVKAEQCAEVMGAIDGYELHPFHVIITESLEYLLEEVLQSIPSRRRPREKRSSRSTIEVTQRVMEESKDEADEVPQQVIEDSEDEVAIVLTSRTFICVAPQRKSSDTVVQSTTEAINPTSDASYFGHFRGYNPRRFA